MKPSIKDAILKQRDPLAYELSQIRSDVSLLKNESMKGVADIKQIAEIIIDKKVEEIKKDILGQLEEYVGAVADEIFKQNLKGDKGDKGDVGPRGERGEKGDPGPQGEPGPTGDRGWIGPAGKDGVDGKDGRDGRDGKDGKDGLPGKSVSLDEVIAAIRPDIDKVLTDIRNSLRTMKSERGGGGGGGLSTPVTFSFTGNGLTTTFTLDTKVAAGGRAIWAYVNGQWIQPNTHFTVSERTLTTTFTPANGDIIEGFYLRA